MALRSINLPEGKLVQRCANCGTERAVAVSGLVLGTKIREHETPDRIVLPVCETCGAQEVLCRTWDPGVQGPAGDHRRAVNSLAAHLRQKGQTAPELAATFAQEIATAKTPVNVGDAVMDVRTANASANVNPLGTLLAAAQMALQ